jgi:predicted Rossmann fold nucleotide-binding protein DprA/Smf involved in DNA uptake
MHIIQELSTAIEKQYLDAKNALEVLSRYLNGVNQQPSDGHRFPILSASDFSPPTVGSNNSSSNREKVLMIIRAHPATVDEIANETGLDVKRIRGVLYAPGLRGKVIKDGGGKGETRYRWRSQASGDG